MNNILKLYGSNGVSGEVWAAGLHYDEAKITESLDSTAAELELTLLDPAWKTGEKVLSLLENAIEDDEQRYAVKEVDKKKLIAKTDTRSLETQIMLSFTAKDKTLRQTFNALTEYLPGWSIRTSIMEKQSSELLKRLR